MILNKYKCNCLQVSKIKKTGSVILTRFVLTVFDFCAYSDHPLTVVTRLLKVSGSFMARSASTFLSKPIPLSVNL
jgi:hypothetical protein